MHSAFHFALVHCAVSQFNLCTFSLRTRHHAALDLNWTSALSHYCTIVLSSEHCACLYWQEKVSRRPIITLNFNQSSIWAPLSPVQCALQHVGWSVSQAQSVLWIQCMIHHTVHLICVNHLIEMQKQFEHRTMVLLILVNILAGEAFLPIYIAHWRTVATVRAVIDTIMDTFGK